MLATSKGFTLIELLIVLAIIGVLSALLMANFVGIRQRARDGQRKADLRQIQAALELYRADTGSYPDTASFPSCPQSFVNGTTTTYMKSIPCDPLTSQSYEYKGNAATGTYCLRACLENTNDAQVAEGKGNGSASCNAQLTDCSTSGYANFTVENP